LLAPDTLPIIGEPAIINRLPGRDLGRTTRARGVTRAGQDIGARVSPHG
jgi:hypothetical protein